MCLGTTQETDEARQDWAGEKGSLGGKTFPKSVRNSKVDQVVVQLLIMYGEMEMENQEIYWATIAQEYCQTHFSMQGNSRSGSGNYF